MKKHNKVKRSIHTEHGDGMHVGMTKKSGLKISDRLKRNKKITLISIFVFASLGVALLVSSFAAGTRTSIKLSLSEGQITNGTVNNGVVSFNSSSNTASEAHLNKLLSASSRNKSSDNPAYVNKPSAGLENDQALFSKNFVADYNNSTAPELTPGEGFGEFRAECDFSHFAYDDPIKYPGQPGKGHLHMFFGNTHANVYSDYNSILNTGNSTCNGHELNRTVYWTSAVIDENGNPRKPIKILVYYKSYGITETNTAWWAPGNNGLQYIKPIAFPENLQLLSNYTSCTATNLSWAQEVQNQQCPSNQLNTTYVNNRQINQTATWTCGILWSNGAHNGGDYETAVDQTQMPKCPTTASVNDNPIRTLQEHVVFPYCSQGKDLRGKSYSDIEKSMSWHRSLSWFFTVCPGSHPNKIPMIEYKISYPVYPGEDTSKWMVASDINPQNGELLRTQYKFWNESDNYTTPTIKQATRGGTSHGGWIGGWNRTILDQWVKSCNQVDGADCAEGVFPLPVGTNTKALVKPKRAAKNPYSGDPVSIPYGGWYTLRYNDIFKTNGQQLHSEICGLPKLFSVGGSVPIGADISHCVRP